MSRIDRHELGNLLHQIISYTDLLEETGSAMYAEKIRKCSFSIEALAVDTDNIEENMTVIDDGKYKKLKKINTLKDKKILVVDDMVENRMILMNIFKALGCNVYEAESGMEAIAKSKKIVPDIITMDIMMDEMDGIEATKNIKKQGHDSFFIAVSALKGQSHDDIELFDVWLPKPFTRVHMLDALAPFLKRKNVIKKSVSILEDCLCEEDKQLINSMASDGAISELEHFIKNLPSSELKNFLEIKLEHLQLEEIINVIGQANAS